MGGAASEEAWKYDFNAAVNGRRGQNESPPAPIFFFILVLFFKRAHRRDLGPTPLDPAAAASTVTASAAVQGFDRVPARRSDPGRLGPLTTLDGIIMSRQSQSTTAELMAEERTVERGPRAPLPPTILSLLVVFLSPRRNRGPRLSHSGGRRVVGQMRAPPSH